MSMAAGEYVSVSSQSDTEQADLAREKSELLEDPEAETEELTQLYVKRERCRAQGRATTHEQGCVGRACSRRAWSVRNHLGEAGAGCPHVSREFLRWSGGASRSRAAVTVKPSDPNCFRGVAVFLALLGLLGARTGGAAIFKPIIRVTFWGALAMAVTAGIGALVGTVV
jgi:vacuolar iron transporter family protein